MHSVGWGWWLIGAIGMIAFWGLVVYAVVALVGGRVRTGEAGPPVEPPSESALEILDRRLAAGELSVEEYEERRAAMQGRERAGSIS
ncbi:MAG TPA: SHOCT domain-containing protein [Solirubrobacteraceae bacterium]|nr:SHOCT domain-containing protein [Solirubrobacteraceae bacterium]